MQTLSAPYKFGDDEIVNIASEYLLGVDANQPGTMILHDPVVEDVGANLHPETVPTSGGRPASDGCSDIILHNWDNYRKIWRLGTVLVGAASIAACAGAPVVTATPSSCSSLLPSEWKAGVAGAPLPDGNAVADWVVFGEQQTGKLEVANGRTRDAITVIERCESRDAAAVKKATRSWLGRLFG
jgi:hypothetical protein